MYVCLMDLNIWICIYVFNLQLILNLSFSKFNFVSNIKLNFELYVQLVYKFIYIKKIRITQ